jgi:hypothetical protein
MNNEKDNYKAHSVRHKRSQSQVGIPEVDETNQEEEDS